MRAGVLGVLGVFSIVMAAHGEYRVWTAADGSSSVEAKYVETLGGDSVVLERKDGKRITVERDRLCEDDRIYVAGVVIPDLQIEVDVDEELSREAEGSYHENKKQQISCLVSVKKTSPEPCARTLTVCICVIGSNKHDDAYKIIYSKSATWLVPQKDEISLRAETTAKSTQSDWGMRGFEYEGYLVFVKTETGEIIACKSNKNTFENHVNMIAKTRSGKVIPMKQIR